MAKTADAISDGNLVERLIRSDQNWSMLPLQVCETVTSLSLSSGHNNPKTVNFLEITIIFKFEIISE